MPAKPRTSYQAEEHLPGHNSPSGQDPLDLSSPSRFISIFNRTYAMTAWVRYIRGADISMKMILTSENETITSKTKDYDSDNHTPDRGEKHL